MSLRRTSSRSKTPRAQPSESGKRKSVASQFAAAAAAGEEHANASDAPAHFLRGTVDEDDDDDDDEGVEEIPMTGPELEALYPGDGTLCRHQVLR